MIKAFNRGKESYVNIIDLSNGQLPTNAKVNDLFYVSVGAAILNTVYRSGTFIIAKNNTKENPVPSDFEETLYTVALDNEITVNNLDDLPIPTDTGDGLGLSYHLEADKTYTIGGQIVLSYPIVLGNTTIRGSWHGSQIVYVGAGALFRNNATSPVGPAAWVRNILLIGSGTNELLGVDSGGLFGLDFVYVQDFILGTISNVSSFYIWDTTIVNPRGKLIVDSVSLSYWHGILADTTVSLGGEALFHCVGTGKTFDATNISVTPQSGDSIFYIDPAYTGRSVFADNRLNGGLGTLFKTGSLTQTSPKIDLKTFPGGAPDSQTIGSFYMERNTDVTTITDVGETKVFTSITDAGGGQVTITSASHGLPNGETVWLVDDAYTGKYVISNVTTDTLEITAPWVGTDTGLLETNWVKVAGTTLPMENEEASMTDDNELTFENIEGKIVTVRVSINPGNDTVSATKDWEFAVMKNGIRLKGSLRTRQMTNKAGEGIILCTTSAIAGDVFEVYTRNILDTTNQIMSNMSMIVS